MDQITVNVVPGLNLYSCLRQAGVPMATGNMGDYERAKVAMRFWRDERLALGEQPCPSYEFCLRMIADWVGV